MSKTTRGHNRPLHMRTCAHGAVVQCLRAHMTTPSQSSTCFSVDVRAYPFATKTTRGGVRA